MGLRDFENSSVFTRRADAKTSGVAAGRVPALAHVGLGSRALAGEAKKDQRGPIM